MKENLLECEVMTIEKSVGAIVVNSSGEYLLLSRVDKNPEYWEFPKGHQENNETDMGTLRRELKEECGIIEFELINNFVGENKYISSSTGNTRIILLYLIKIQNNAILVSEEHNKYKWLNFNDAMKMLNHETWRKILTDANTMMQMMG